MMDDLYTHLSKALTLSRTYVKSTVYAVACDLADPWERHIFTQALDEYFQMMKARTFPQNVPRAKFRNAFIQGLDDGK